MKGRETWKQDAATFAVKAIVGTTDKMQMWKRLINILILAVLF